MVGRFVELVLQRQLADLLGLLDRIVRGGIEFALRVHRLEQDVDHLQHRLGILRAIDVAELDQSDRERLVVLIDDRFRDLQIAFSHRLGKMPDRSKIQHS